MYRQSDYPIVSGKPMKVGGEKGIAGTAREDRDTPARLRTGVQVTTKLVSLNSTSAGKSEGEIHVTGTFVDGGFSQSVLLGVEKG